MDIIEFKNIVAESTCLSEICTKLKNLKPRYKNEQIQSRIRLAGSKFPYFTMYKRNKDRQ